MGNKQNTTSQATILKEKEKRESIKNIKEKPENILDKNNFDFLYVIGRGGFGKVNNLKLIKYINSKKAFEKIKSK